jgi:hypothetical protein
MLPYTALPAHSKKDSFLKPFGLVRFGFDTNERMAFGKAQILGICSQLRATIGLRKLEIGGMFARSLHRENRDISCCTASIVPIRQAKLIPWLSLDSLIHSPLL